MQSVYTTACLVMLVAEPTSAQSGSPAKPKSVQHVDFVVPNAGSVVELASTSDAVVRVRVQSMRNEARKGEHGTDVFRAYRVAVVEEYKKHTRAVPGGATMTVLQRGGQVETPDLILVAEGTEALAIGAEYALFLHWNEHSEAFEIAYGPAGVFQLGRDGMVTAFAKTPLADRLRGRSVHELIAGLRQIPRERRPGL